MQAESHSFKKHLELNLCARPCAEGWGAQQEREDPAPRSLQTGGTGDRIPEAGAERQLRGQCRELRAVAWPGLAIRKARRYHGGTVHAPGSREKALAPDSAQGWSHCQQGKDAWRNRGGGWERLAPGLSYRVGRCGRRGRGPEGP